MGQGSSIDGSYADVAVIGAGMAGLMAAIEVARAGCSVVVLESKKEIGIPVQCGESISENTLKLTGLEEEGPWIAHHVDGFRIRSPSGKDLYASIKGFSIRRDLMEQEMARRAGSLGADVRCRHPVRDAELKDGSWTIRTAGGTVKAPMVIIACGANRHLIREFGFQDDLNCFRGLGVKLRRRDFSRDLLFLVKGDLQGGYAWYFPRGMDVNVGVCARSEMVGWLSKLRQIFSIDESEIMSYHGGSIPVGGLREKLVGGSCLLVGDAGGFSNPVTKGGIIGAVLSGREAGRAVPDHLSGDLAALDRWENGMRSHEAFSPLNLVRAEFLASLDDDLLNGITSMVDGRDVNNTPNTELLKMVVTRPDLMRRLKKGVHLVRGGREWMKWSF
jgi:geranylgeranyl reductase family protein